MASPLDTTDSPAEVAGYPDPTAVELPQDDMQSVQGDEDEQSDDDQQDDPLDEAFMPVDPTTSADRADQKVAPQDMTNQTKIIVNHLKHSYTTLDDLDLMFEIDRTCTKSEEDWNSHGDEVHNLILLLRDNIRDGKRQEHQRERNGHYFDTNSPKVRERFTELEAKLVQYDAKFVEIPPPALFTSDVIPNIDETFAIAFKETLNTVKNDGPRLKAIGDEYCSVAFSSMDTNLDVTELAFALWRAEWAYELGRYDYSCQSVLEMVSQAHPGAIAYYNDLKAWRSKHPVEKEPDVYEEDHGSVTGKKIKRGIDMGELYQLDAPDSIAYRAFVGPDTKIGQFEIGDELRPLKCSRDPSGATLRVKFLGYPIEFHLRVKAVIERKTAANTTDPKPQSIAYINFFHGQTWDSVPGRTSTNPAFHVFNVRVEASDDLRIDETGDIVSVGYYRLSFDTYGGEGSHLGYRNPQTFSDESTQLLDYMAGLQGPLEKPVTVKVRIPVNHYDRLTIASYRMSFHQLSLSERRVPYQAYFNNRRNPQIQYPDFLQRDVIFRNSQYVPDESEFEVESVKTAAPATTDTDSAVTTGKVTAPAVATQQDTQTRDEERVGGIIPHQARDSYYSLFEYLVKFGYGLAIDHQKQNEDITAMNGPGHKVCFTVVGNSRVFAHIKLRHQANTNATVSDAILPRLQEGAHMTISADAEGFSKEIKVHTMAISKSLTETYGELVLLVIGKPAKFFIMNNLSVPHPATLRHNIQWLHASIAIDVPNSGIRRQISALSELWRNPHAQKFIPTLRNQDPTKLPRTDATTATNVSAQEVQRRLTVVKEYRKWTRDQKAALDLPRTLRGYFALLRGFPGTGKTKTLAALMVFLLSIGYNCLGTAPTHAAADNLAEELSKLHADPYWSANKIPFPKPLRVYPPSQEQAAMKKEGRPTREEFVPHHNDDDDDDDEDDDDEPDAGNGDADDGAKKSAEPVVKDADQKPGEPVVSDEESTLDVELMLLEILNQAAKAQHDKMYKNPGMSLQSRAMDFLGTGEKVMASYGRQDNADGADNHYDDEGDLVMGDKAEVDLLEPEPVDMAEEMRGFLKLLKETPMQKWEKEDKSHYKAAWRHLRNAVLKNAELIITTCNAVGAPGIRNCFGHNEQPIMVVVEECSMENDINVMMFLKLAHLERVQGVILCGDNAQLAPTFPSDTANVNEFVEAIGTPLVERLINTDFPSVDLTTQFRMHPDLAAFPNEYTYNGRLKSSRDNYNLKPHPDYVAVLREFVIAPRTQLDPFSTIGINVSDGQTHTESETRSRYNQQHVNVVIGFLRVMVQAGCFKTPRKMVIVTPYHAQIRQYTAAMMVLCEELKIHRSMLPVVRTMSSVQSQEWDEVILDFPHDRADNMRDLGIAANPKLCNVAFTRGRRSTLVVFNQQVAHGEVAEKWRSRAQKHGRPTNELNDYPYLIAYIKRITQNSRVHSKLGRSLAEFAYEAKATVKRNFAEELEDGEIEEEAPQSPGRGWTNDEDATAGGDVAAGGGGSTGGNAAADGDGVAW